MNYKRTIKILKTAAEKADDNLLAEIESAIELIGQHSETDGPDPGIDCKYNHNGLCWGQKGAPECTAKYGYCPCSKQDQEANT